VVVLHAEPDFELLSAEALGAIVTFLKSWARWTAATAPGAKLVRGASRTDELRDALRGSASPRRSARSWTRAGRGA
jgi:hypothetical protein